MKGGFLEDFQVKKFRLFIMGIFESISLHNQVSCIKHKLSCVFATVLRDIGCLTVCAMYWKRLGPSWADRAVGVGRKIYMQNGL